MLLLVILGLFILLLLLLLFIPAEVGVVYRLENGTQNLRARLKILFIPLMFNIPLEKDKKKTEKEVKKEAEQAEKRKSPKEFVAFSKRLYKTFQEEKGECKDLFEEIKKKLTCANFAFALQYGTGNPATTGILNGAVWTASTGIVKLLDSTFPVQNKSLTVEPVFDRACLNIHSKATFKFRLIYILFLLYRIKQLFKKIQDKLKTEN